MEIGEKELLESEVRLSETKIDIANNVMENGAIEQKIDFIISEIKRKEQRKLLENRQRIRNEEIISEFFRGIIL